MSLHPPRWGAAHTEEINLFKGLPKHIRGEKIVKMALEELYKKEMIIRFKKTNQLHVSLNPQKKKEIEDLLF